ncbi:MAG: MaoC family dehydratase N-terminal domain-containing protein [Micrococcales bacterium]|nr:MaoC family dehydratase N-terminal domain-containing protein [Micrococcales bacterium]
MPVNPALEGRTLPPIGPYLVGREKVREFARAVQSRSPLSIDADAASAAGYEGLLAPPTFAIVVQEAALQQLLAEPDTGIDFARVVHGDQRFGFVRPVVAGDELLAHLSVTSIKTLAGNSMVTAETAITDLDGELVVTAVSTLVVRAEQ